MVAPGDTVYIQGPSTTWSAVAPHGTRGRAVDRPAVHRARREGGGVGLGARNMHLYTLEPENHLGDLTMSPQPDQHHECDEHVVPCDRSHHWTVCPHGDRSASCPEAGSFPERA
jgi:hypothetical protein